MAKVTMDTRRYRLASHPLLLPPSRMLLLQLRTRYVWLLHILTIYQFKPAKKFTFRNVSLDLADTHLDLRNANGVVVGRFTMNHEDGYTMALLSTLNQRNAAKCTVKWVPEVKGKDKSDGRIHFDCNAKLPATGYTGQIPIAIEITGLTKNRTQRIYLNTDGFNFRNDFEDLEHMRHAILLSLGYDLEHNVKISKVNGRRYNNDKETYEAIMKLVEKGADTIKLMVEPMIHVKTNIQEPYSSNAEGYNKDIGNITIADYTKMLKDKKRLMQMANDNLGTDAGGFTLVGINDLHEGAKGFDGKRPYKMPIEIDEKLTFMPNVTVRFHYLDTFINSQSFPVHTALSKVVDMGRDIVKTHNGGKDKKAFRLYAYALPGCPLEESDVYDMMKLRKSMSINELPFSEACLNRRTHIINFFYLNNKPANYVFDVELTNPDGSKSKKHRITVKYVNDADLNTLKDAIVRELEREGYMITPEDLTFVNVSRADGGNLTDDTHIMKLADIPKEQMMGHVSHLDLKADPHLMGYFTEPNGKHDTFTFKLPNTRPSASDIKNAFENELHLRNLLKPDEPLHTSLKFHPLDNKHKIRMNAFVNPDESGHFPSGIKLRGLAAEADSRYEIPISYTGDDGKVHRFSVYVPRGATDQQIEDLIADEIQRRKYGDRPHDMYIRMKGHEDAGLNGLWDDFNDNMEFYVEPARLVDVGGIIDDHPTKMSIRIHPHETRDELERAIRANLMHSPEFERSFHDNPNHINDISTLIINDHGNPYTDDDFKNHDIYNNIRKVRIGISDHPLTLTWRDPVTGKETAFCFTRKGDKGCSGIPVNILSNLTIQQLTDILKNNMSVDNRELYQSIESIPRTNHNLTSMLKLDGIKLITGQFLSTPEIQMSDTVDMIEHLYGTNLSHVGSLVFSLMTKHEQQRLNAHPQVIRLSMNKHGDEPESHVMSTGDLGPSELRYVINKYFSGVDDGDQLDGMTVNGEKYDGQPLSFFLNKMDDKDKPLKVDFGVANEGKHGKMPKLDMRIKPKYNETLRSYFDRASEEPGDFGLSPLHAYTVECLNDKGERIHVNNILDTPVGALGMCAELRVHPKEKGRSQHPGQVFAMEPDSNMEIHTSITLDENKDGPTNLNRQLRNFLMDLPEDDLEHVTIMIDDKPVKCSISSLRDAYFIRNLTVDMLLSICNMDARKAEPSVFKIQLEPGTEGGKGKGSRKGHLDYPEGTPLCYFTLHKGPNNVGLSSIIPITLGTLKSPLKEFNAKLAHMFGDTLSHVNGLRLSVVKNGELTPCNRNGRIKNLGDFQKLALQHVFQMCGIPVGIPEDDTFYHFRVNIPFGENIVHPSGAGMGGSIPVEMLYKDDDEISTIHYNEDLRTPLQNFLINQPDMDPQHLDRYLLRIKGDNPGSESVDRTYNLNHLPSHMTLASVFPHTPMSNISLQVEDTEDPYNSAGGWRTGLSYPVNSYRNNFDDIKEQMILNLKAMHGNQLNKLNGYNVNVTINGKKHQCNIKSLPDLERMTFEEFSRNCVNVDNIQNNPSMNFNVGYESGRGDPEINLNFVCGDYDTYHEPNLRINDPIPKPILEKLTKKYSPKGLQEAQWGIMINGMQGNCHLDDIRENISMADILELCGVDDIHSRHFDITLHDYFINPVYVAKIVAAENDKDKKGGKGENISANGDLKIRMNLDSDDGFSPLMTPNVHYLHASPEFANVHPNVFLNMPQQYSGPSINMDNRRSLNDYIHDIIVDEDKVDPGKPINIQIISNGDADDINTMPLDELNSPTGYLMGNVSINVRPDPSGSLPGTIRTFHLPATDKPLSNYLSTLRSRIPDMEDKHFVLVGKNSMLDEDHIPLHILSKPLKELGEMGYIVSLVNSPQDMKPSGAVKVNIVSRDGYSGNSVINDIQEPLRDVFAKMGADGVDVKSLAGAKFKVVIDGLEKTCSLPTLDHLLTSVSMQDILTTCGIHDFNHCHDFTLYFDSLLGGDNGPHRSPVKLEVDLDNKVDSTKNVDFSSDVDLSGGALDFLKSKPNSHIFFEMEGKGFREFIEVDTEKFRQLLKAHPSVVDLLLRMGIPQEHLGGVDCLKIILSTLSQVLQGHQQFSVNNSGTKATFNPDEPLSTHKSIMDVSAVLKDHPDQDVNVSVELANGNTKSFTIPNREFLHALNGGLSFKNVALWGLSQAEADQITDINFNTAPIGGVPEDITLEGSNNDDMEVPSESQKAGSTDKKNAHQKRRDSTSSESSDTESTTSTESSTSSQSSPSEARKSMNAGVITPDTLLRDVPIISKAIKDHKHNVKFIVGLNDGSDPLELLVKGTMLKGDNFKTAKISDMLGFFLPRDQLSSIASISVQLVNDSHRFFVPLAEHNPIILPIMAADHPQNCKIQEFKNAWNPQETEYRQLTLQKAMQEYGRKYKISKNVPPRAAYLLRKEPGNNLLAEILFDEEHPADERVLNMNIGKPISNGSTLFLRYKSTGELVM
eukprot:XP_001609840.1 hypothetical protein [Babesia bovis T2Bo]